jgi:hypothetical protein
MLSRPVYKYLVIFTLFCYRRTRLNHTLQITSTYMYTLLLSACLDPKFNPKGLFLPSYWGHNMLSSHGATAPVGPGPPHYRGFTTTLRPTTLGGTPLDEWWVRRKENTQPSQKTDIHAPGGSRTQNPSKREAVDPRLRPRSHWGRLPRTLV